MVLETALPDIPLVRNVYLLHTNYTNVKYGSPNWFHPLEHWHSSHCETCSGLAEVFSSILFEIQSTNEDLVCLL